MKWSWIFVCLILWISFFILHLCHSRMITCLNCLVTSLCWFLDFGFDCTFHVGMLECDLYEMSDVSKSLLQVNTQFLKMETLLDDSVGRKIELQIERGGIPLTVDLMVRFYAFLSYSFCLWFSLAECYCCFIWVDVISCCWFEAYVIAMLFGMLHIVDEGPCRDFYASRLSIQSMILFFIPSWMQMQIHSFFKFWITEIFPVMVEPYMVCVLLD